MGTKIQNGLNVIGQNLSNSQAPVSVQVTNGSLFSLASQYYGDPSQYQTIASANGLSSFQTGPTLQNIIIPPIPALSS
jgi:nucleoid-associated protein YgaU